jgi:hypothetical protein
MKENQPALYASTVADAAIAVFFIQSLANFFFLFYKKTAKKENCSENLRERKRARLKWRDGAARQSFLFSLFPT